MALDCLLSSDANGEVPGDSALPENILVTLPN